MTHSGDYQIGDEPVPGYRLVGFLGRGTFGSVWKATAPGGTEVAIKIVPLVLKGALKEFRSLKLVKRIQFPHLVPIIAIWLKDAQGKLLEESAFEEVGEQPTAADRGTLTTDTLVMGRQTEPAELIIAMGLGQQTLSDRLEEYRRQGVLGIPVDELLDYLQDAARAIDYLNAPRHQLITGIGGIQHCDIKPSNILIVGGAAQVCDYSLARGVDDLRATSLALTAYYAAPEVIELNQPSSSTDQYALAVSYFELRTGGVPFPPNATVHKVVQAHLTGKLDLTSLPAAEQAIIRRATSLRPQDRFPSAQDMIRALRVATKPEIEAAQPRNVFRRTMAALAFLATLTGIVAVGWPYFQSDFQLLTASQLQARAGDEVNLPVHIRRRIGFGNPVQLELTGLPRGVTVVPGQIAEGASAGQVTLKIAANADPGETRLTLAATADKQQHTSTLLLSISAAEVWLPPDCVASPQAKIVDINGRHFADVIICRKSGLEVLFRLVAGRDGGNPPSPRPFYMMENKVSNELFARFAEEHPNYAGEEWKNGAMADQRDLKADAHPQLPVVRVNWGQAARFATWLGGNLPTVDQWDEAAGRYAENRGEGPFFGGAKNWSPTEIAINRAALGPLPVGTATLDVSTPYRCRDMAGNGIEWTRDSRDANFKPSPDKLDERISMVLRGRSYAYPDPLRFVELDDPLKNEDLPCTRGDNIDLSFRVVLDNLP